MVFNKNLFLLCSLGLAIGSTGTQAQACGECPHAKAQARTRIIESRVEVAPSTVATRRYVVPSGTSISMLQAGTRSNYDARLTHLLEQIELGGERGWLSSSQVAGFRKWQADLVRADADLRLAGGGVMSRADANQMERFVNSLALAVTNEINRNAPPMP